MEEKINKLLDGEDCIIIFDTNVYLNLYEYSPEASDFFIEIIYLTIDKIYLPSTVKREFDKNHETCFGRQKKKFENVAHILKKPTDQMRDKIKKQISILRNFKFPDIDKLESRIEDEINNIEDIFNDYVDSHDTLNIINNRFLDKDKINNLVNDLVNRNRLLDGFNLDEIYRLCEEGEKRYKKDIPPGYKDSKDKSGVQMYNDFIIWKEAIRYCKDNKKNLIFVTDDVKEDWYKLCGKERIGFREELNKEFNNQTSKEMIGITSYEFFTALAKKYEKEIPSTVEWALGYDSKRYIDEIIELGFIEDVLSIVIENGDMYVDTSSLTSYDGEEFRFENEPIETSFISYEFDGYYDGQAVYCIEINIVIKAYSREYWGRDDDSKEPILSEERTHILKGDVRVQLVRNIDSYIDKLVDDTSYDELEIVSGDLVEIQSYTNDELCVECRKKVGDYQNYYDEPICEDCMSVNEEGDICTYCGKKVPYDLMEGDGYCSDCVKDYDL